MRDERIKSRRETKRLVDWDGAAFSLCGASFAARRLFHLPLFRRWHPTPLPLPLPSPPSLLFAQGDNSSTCRVDWTSRVDSLQVWSFILGSDCAVGRRDEKQKRWRGKETKRPRDEERELVDSIEKNERDHLKRLITIHLWLRKSSSMLSRKSPRHSFLYWTISFFSILFQMISTLWLVDFLFRSKWKLVDDCQVSWIHCSSYLPCNTVKKDNRDNRDNRDSQKERDWSRLCY